MLKHFVVLSAVLTLSGCRWPAGPDARVEIQADRVTYSADRSDAVVYFHVVNVGSVTAQLARCGDRIMVGVERRQDGGWGPSSGDACIAISPMVPLKLEPGHSVSSGRGLYEPGTYRLRLDARFDASHAADRQVASNGFTVQ